MSESVVRSRFSRLSGAMYGFDPAALSRNPERARVTAIAAFAHDDPEPFLRSLLYIGPVTWRHLAKNLGLPIAKADRHLTRLAFATARQSVDGLCDEIARWLGEPVAVVDLVLWRWSVLHACECRRSWNPMFHDSPPGNTDGSTGEVSRAASPSQRPGDLHVTHMHAT